MVRGTRVFVPLDGLFCDWNGRGWFLGVVSSVFGKYSLEEVADFGFLRLCWSRVKRNVRRSWRASLDVIRKLSPCSSSVLLLVIQM